MLRRLWSRHLSRLHRWLPRKFPGRPTSRDQRPSLHLETLEDRTLLTAIAFTSFRDGNPEIYVMNADGSNPVRLTNSSDLDTTPAWAPDGSKLLFVSDRDAINRNIFVM